MDTYGVKATFQRKGPAMNNRMALIQNLEQQRKHLVSEHNVVSLLHPTLDALASHAPYRLASL
jgi:hypothetical protein